MSLPIHNENQLRPDAIAEIDPERDVPGARSVSETLDQLKQKLDSITEYFDPKKRIVYYDYPIYANNVGDLLIHLGTEEFFRAKNLLIWRRFSMLDLPVQIRGMDDDVVILCHGGGNFGDIWPRSQSLREGLVARYPNNRIVFLPQTVYYQSAKQAERSLQRLRAHKDLHIFARDQVSEQFLRDGGLSATCMPDMFHAMEGKLFPSRAASEQRALKLCRTDCEIGKGIAPPYGEDIPSADWKGIIGKPCLALSRVAQALLIGFRVLGVQSSASYKIWYPVRDIALRRGIACFSEYETIYTDRLHGMLLGLMLRRRVCAFDNSYGKLSSYYECWLKGTQNLSLIG